MSAAAVDGDLIAGAEELLAALKSQRPLTRESRAALLRQVDKLRCGLQGPADAMHFQGTVVSPINYYQLHLTPSLKRWEAYTWR
ncbi:hypothetical protein PG993_014923 [Apiospora rasikravindrae]|uniref:Uncharacterized protein n=1 Tax=Apiospora rasikravindrae TaxID=990691 RepID=A0ABR1RP50_9PEZI